MQAFRARNLPSRFNESKQTAYSMLIIVLILVVNFQINEGLLNSKGRDIVILISMVVINYIQFIKLYSYTLFIVLFRTEKNTRQSFQLSMMRNAEKRLNVSYI